MFKTGDYFLYGTQGVCLIDSICDHEINGTSRQCYVFHPINNDKAKIMTPVDNQKVSMRGLIMKPEAKYIMHLFSHNSDSDLAWNDDKKTRYKIFSESVSSFDAIRSARALKILIIKKEEKRLAGKKMPVEDERFLDSIRQSLSDELAMVLDTESSLISRRIEQDVRAVAFPA